MKIKMFSGAVSLIIAGLMTIGCVSPVSTSTPVSTATPTLTPGATATPTATPTVITTLPPITSSTITTTVQSFVTFDFDGGSPAILPGLSTPFDYAVGNTTARFGSPSDPAAFSIQNPETTFIKLAQFSGNYLNDSNPFRNVLEIRFSREISLIKLNFATVEYHGPGEVNTPTGLKLTAYLDSNGKTMVGSTTANGILSGDTYPLGTMSFFAQQQSFNLVTIEIVPQTNGATDFLVDNIAVLPYLQQ